MKRHCIAADSQPSAIYSEHEARQIIATIPREKLVLLEIMHGRDDLAKIASAWQALRAQRAREA